MINKPKLLMSVAEESIKEKPEIGEATHSFDLSFVQYCVKKVDEDADATEYSATTADNEGFGTPYSPSLGHSSIFDSKNPMDLWEKIHLDHKLKKPAPGCLAIWKKGKEGHVAIITHVLDSDKVEVIEGNEKKQVVKSIRHLDDKFEILLGIFKAWI
jgi:hypothetical protein